MGRAACTEHQCLYKGALLVDENEHTTFGLYSGSPGFKSALRPALSTGVYVVLVVSEQCRDSTQIRPQLTLCALVYLVFTTFLSNGPKLP
jgi:hypothetical protein